MRPRRSRSGLLKVMPLPLVLAVRITGQDLPVELRSRVERGPDGSYAYALTLQNTSRAEVRLASLRMLRSDNESDWTVAGLGATDAPSNWSDPLSAGHATWDLYADPIAPGATVAGMRLTSPDPPALRTVELDPWVEDRVEALVQSNYGQRCLPTEDELWATRGGAVVERWALGPLTEKPGTYAHLNRFEKDLRRAADLGWLSAEVALPDLLTALESARQAALRGDWTAWQGDLETMARLAANAPERACRVEVKDLVRLTVAILAAARPSSCEPRLELDGPTGPQSMGRVARISVRAVNDAGRTPITLLPIRFAVVSGPHEGLTANVTTDARGKAGLELRSRGEGDDLVRLDVPVPAERGCPTQPLTATTTVDWHGGPNLKVVLSSAAKVSVQPGDTILVSEETRNFGNAVAGPSVTRFYLSNYAEWGAGTRVPIAQRRVPPLKPREESRVADAPVEVPADLAAGSYYVYASADDDDQVPETCEWDNHSISVFASEMPRGGLAIAMPVAVPVSTRPPMLPVPRTLPATHRDPKAVPWIAASYVSAAAVSGAWFAPGPEQPPPTPKPTPRPCFTEAEWGKLWRPRQPEGAMEHFLVPLDRVPETVFRDAVGVATLVRYDCAGGPARRTSDVAAYRCGPLPTFEKTEAGFRSGTPLGGESLRPLSGYVYDGVVERFPITGRDGNFVEIVAEVAQDRRVWVASTEPPGPLEVLVTQLDGEFHGEGRAPRESDIDPGVLLWEPIRRLYKGPDGRAPWRPYALPHVNSSNGEDEDELGGPHLVEIRNGFGLLAVYNSDDRAMPFGWIKLRDEEGRLTVWLADSGC